MWERINNDILPNALMIGVNYDLFWSLNPKSLSPFIKAFNLKQEYDDWMAWRNGLYIQMAIGSVLNEKNKYPTKPLTRVEEVNQMEVIKQRLIERMAVINSRFEESDNIDE